jgi:uncharacterized protein YbjT (DUF2867 family)
VDLARDVFVTGGTGYVGRPFIETLMARGHRVRALARPQSVERVPKGASCVIGDALDPGFIAGTLRSDETLVHLVGTPHPNPSKAAEFHRVDLASARASIAAARHARAAHFVYVSVAQPAPVMQAYIAVRAEGERAIAAAGLTATVLRPWYVLGPGHWWPVALMPVYAAAQVLPRFRDGAQRLGLLRLRQMVEALVWAVEHPAPEGSVRVLDVPAIRSLPAS